MNDEFSFRQSQTSLVLLAIFCGTPLAIVAAHQFKFPGQALPWQLMGVTALFVLIMLCLTRLTVTLYRDELVWQFGWLGWPRFRAPLADIQRAEACRSSWREGWGIRYSADGMLYNISGLDAVRITRRDGRRFRIGTNDAEGLVRALNARL